jgi:hypothetical protein
MKRLRDWMIGVNYLILIIQNWRPQRIMMMLSRLGLMMKRRLNLRWESLAGKRRKNMSRRRW